MSTTITSVMQYGSLKGESNVPDYQDWIVVEDVGLAGNWTVTSQRGTDEEVSESTLQMSSFSVTRTFDLSTFPLLQTFLDGDPEAMVTIKEFGGDGGKNAWTTYKLEACSISSWSLFVQGGGQSVETLELVTAKMQAIGVGYGANGQLNSNNPVGYDYTKGQTS